jgi:hypothetical protein
LVKADGTGRLINGGAVFNVTVSRPLSQAKALSTERDIGAVQ